MSLTGLLTVTSVDPVSGEEQASGELIVPGQRGGLPFRSARGDSLEKSAPELAARIADRMRALDLEHGRPMRARFAIAGDAETLDHVEPAPLAPLALVRVLVERVRSDRLTREEALARITPAEIEAAGAFVLDETPAAPLTKGLAASQGAAAGRLALPPEFANPSDEPRVVVVDDAAPEDAMAIRAAAAIVATNGGLTADAAIAARALRKPCVVSAPLRFDDRAGPALGDWVTVDGSRGEVYAGRLRTRWAPSTPLAAELIGWLAIREGERPGEALARARTNAGQGPPR